MTAQSDAPIDVLVEPIRTSRLTLVSMSVPFMEALVRGDLEAASREINATVNPWFATQLEHFLKLRLTQLATDPSIRPWLGRAMVVDDANGSRHVIGSIGFHGPPDSEGRLEIGYSVEPAKRRQGFAREAIRAMFDWAHATHGVTRFVASISPGNEASLRLAEQFGFTQIGEQMDDIDGLEYVFEATWPRSRQG